MDDRWLSVEEVAEYLGVSKDAVHSWVPTKGMPSYRVGRFWKFNRDVMDGWVRTREPSTTTSSSTNTSATRI
jgi:excisionase family DNA binding protein